MRGSTAERINTSMKNAEATNTTETAAVAEQGAHVAPEKDSSKKDASQKKGAPKGQKTAKGAKTKKTAKATAPKKEAKTSKKGAKPARAKEATTPRPESKGAKILEMIGRPKGATLAEIMKATDWQAHSVRGFISTAGKKHGIKIDSSKNEAGDRVYRIAK
jgi:cobalamin-dependent methionine synthase I